MAQIKLVSSSVEQRRGTIEPKHPKLTVTRQCELLGLPRASFYYEPVPESDETNQHDLAALAPARWRPVGWYVSGTQIVTIGVRG